MTIRWIAAAALVATLLMVTGCGTGRARVDENLTVWEAKELTQDMEDEIVRLLPAKYMGAATQLSEGSLLSCSSDGGKQWSGWSEAQLVGDPGSDEVLAAIDAHFSARDEYTITSEHREDEEVRFVRGSFGSIWIVAFTPADLRVRITSGSPCFRLPEGVNPGGGF